MTVDTWSINNEIPSITDRMCGTVKLRLLDINAVIRSDSRAFLARLRDSYASFIVAEHAVGTNQTIECSLFTGQVTSWEKPVLLIGEEHFFVPEASTLQDELLLSIVIAKLLQRTRTHYLFHAGVVTYGNEAILIAANSNYGKSTLVYELVRRGLHYYSDDLAPIGLHDGQVHPFPRMLQLRPGSLEILDLDPDSYLVPMWKDKYLISQMDENPVMLDERATLQAVVFLRDPTKSQTQPSGSCERKITVVLEKLSDRLLYAIRQLPEVIDIGVMEIGGYPTLQIVTPCNSQLVYSIEELCRAYQSAIMYAAKSVSGRPSFDNPPSLRPISRSQAALELLQHLQIGAESTLVKKVAGNNAIQLYRQVAGLVRPAHCYHLDVGPLQEMADLVMTLVGDE